MFSCLIVCFLWCDLFISVWVCCGTVCTLCMWVGTGIYYNETTDWKKLGGIHLQQASGEHRKLQKVEVSEIALMSVCEGMDAVRCGGRSIREPFVETGWACLKAWSAVPSIKLMDFKGTRKGGSIINKVFKPDLWHGKSLIAWPLFGLPFLILMEVPLMKSDSNTMEE